MSEEEERKFWDLDNWDLYMVELKYYREKYGDSYRLTHKTIEKPLEEWEKLMWSNHVEKKNKK